MKSKTVNSHQLRKINYKRWEEGKRLLKAMFIIIKRLREKREMALGFDTISNKKYVSVSDFWDNYNDDGVSFRDAWGEFRKRFIEIIKKYPNPKILDLGCSKKGTLPELMKSPDIACYHCVDFSPESIKDLKKLKERGVYPVIEIYESDVVEFVKNCKQKYDIIIMFGLLMYMENPAIEELFDNISSILNVGGKILIEEPNVKNIKDVLDRYSKPMEVEFMNKLASKVGSITIDTYNIPKARGAVKRTVNLLWWLEGQIEKIMRKTKLGYEYLITIKK